MPIPNFDKDIYTPEEVHELIKTNLGEEAARQFRMYFNKVQKVPPHKVEMHPLSYRDGEAFEYRFKMGDYAKQIGIPPEVLQFVMVPGQRHGGGSQDNMGWIQMLFRDIKSPQGNTVQVAIADEIQSDFAQRISRIRQLLAGKMPNENLLPWEQEAYEKIINNPQLVEPQQDLGPVPPTQIGNFQLAVIHDSSGEYIAIIAPDPNGGGGTTVGKVTRNNAEGSVTYNPVKNDRGIVPDEAAIKGAMEVAQYAQKEGTPTTYKPTQLLKSIINKIESTSYSDILRYLFNKAVGFAKGKGAAQLWVPSSEMKMREWQGNAKHGLDNLKDMFKRLYDDNSVSFEAVKNLEQTDNKDYWVIDLGKVSDLRMAKVVRLSARYWKDERTGTDSNNWKQMFDTYITNYNNFYDPSQEIPEEGGVLEADDAKGIFMVEGFINEFLPTAAFGDEKFTQEFKAYLQQKLNFTMPPEMESKLLHGGNPDAEWQRQPYVDKYVKPQEPKHEEVEGAPSVDELNNMFKFNTIKRFKGFE